MLYPLSYGRVVVHLQLCVGKPTVLHAGEPAILRGGERI
jgi:hypothetical protein